MINKILFKKEWKSNYKLWILFALVLTVYCSLIVAMYDPKLGESLSVMAKTMPEIFAAFGMANVGTTMIEFLANYLYGFILLVFPILFIVLLANRLVARYVDNGSMAYLLATPNKRRTIAVTQAVFLIQALFILMLYAVLLCIAVSAILFPKELDISKFVVLNVGLFGLLFFLSGLCFFSSCAFQNKKYSYGFGAGLSIIFILIQMLSQVGGKLENLKYLTPFTLFSVDGIVADKPEALLQFVILYVIGIVFYVIGIIRFEQKDLCL